MRITAGQWRGRKLLAPDGTDVRPTSDKARQAIFNILNGHGLPDEAHVLDAFCGTGALGLEALSRGAASAIFIDNNKTSLDFCRRNAAAMKADSLCTFIQRDVTHIGAKPGAIPPAHLLFLDPPYRQNLAAPALNAIIEGGWLAPASIAVIEMESDAPMPVLPVPPFDRRVYGAAAILFCRLP